MGTRLYRRLPAGGRPTPIGQPDGLCYSQGDEYTLLILDTIDFTSTANPLGAKGIGSVSTVPSTAAIANAVMNALSGTGIRHVDAPYTPETLWRAIRNKSRLMASLSWPWFNIILEKVKCALPV